MIPNDLYIWKLTCRWVFLDKQILSSFFGKSIIFKYIFPCARHVLMTFELSTLCTRLCIFPLYISHLLLSSKQASIAIWTILISKSWWWLMKPKHQRQLYIIKYSLIHKIYFQNWKVSPYFKILIYFFTIIFTRNEIIFWNRKSIFNLSVDNLIMV